MTVKKSYNRFFIIFQEEDKGYAIAIDKQPTGYAKIENRSGKCKMTVYAQNLKKEKGPYHFCIIDTMRTPALLIKIGEVKIDEMGRGETWWEYNEENIAESKSTIDKFNIAVIMAEGSPDAITAPLAGYTGKEKIMWKEKIVIDKKHEHEHEHEHEHGHEHNRGQKQEDIEGANEEVRDSENLDEEALKFKEYEEQIRSEIGMFDEPIDIDIKETREEVTELEDGITKHAETMGAYDYDTREFDETIMENDNADVVDEEYNAGCLRYEMQRHDEHEHKHKHSGPKSYSDIFHYVLNNFEELEEVFEDDGDSGCRWWKIPHDCDTPVMEEQYYPFLCTVFYLKMTYPNIDYVKYFHRRGHYYFGIKYDTDNEVKYLMYGIEGSNSMKEQPYMGMTGFGKWMPLKNRNTGMWIMFYNPQTGNIMVERND